MTIKIPDLSKLTEDLTPLERVRLMIEDDHYKKETGNGILTPQERVALKNGVKNYNEAQREEYAYYICLWTTLPLYFIDIQTCWLRLCILDATLQALHSRIQLYPILLRTVRLLKRFPVLISEADYKKRAENNKKQLLDEILSIESLAKEEAFYSLTEAGKIDGDWIDGWFYRNYLDSTENESMLKEKQEWIQEVEKQRNKIEDLIKNGILNLKEGKLSRYFESERGKLTKDISVESWYQYKDKKDKEFNENLERIFDNLNLEDRNDKTEDLVFAIGHLTEKNTEKYNLVDSHDYHPDLEVEFAIKSLKTISFLEIEDDFFLPEKVAFKEEIKKLLLFVTKKTREKIRDLLLFKETINYFEEKLGTNVITSAQQKDLNGYLEVTQEIRERHDKTIKNLLRGFYGRGTLEKIKAEQTEDEEEKRRLLELSKQKSDELVNEFVGDINDYLIGETCPSQEEIKGFISNTENEFKQGADKFWMC